MTPKKTTNISIFNSKTFEWFISENLEMLLLEIDLFDEIGVFYWKLYFLCVITGISLHKVTLIDFKEEVWVPDD
jgi:hypothetical protein